MNLEHEFYRVDELAEKLRVNPMTIYRWIKSGKLIALKIGKEYRIDQNTFNKFIENTKKSSLCKTNYR